MALAITKELDMFSPRLTPSLSALALALALTPACDEEDADFPLDRAEATSDVSDVPLRFAYIGTGKGSGSTRRNTAHVLTGAELGSVSRTGKTELPGLGPSNYKFIGIRAGSHKYRATERDIEVVDGLLRIGTKHATIQEMVGTEWFFDSSGGEFSVKIMAAATAVVPGGTIPLYNFEWAEGGIYDDPPVDRSVVCPELLTAPEATNTPFDPVAAVDNYDFNIKRSGSLFGGIAVGPTGSISPEPDAFFLGCASGAVIKGGLWGYTPFDRDQSGDVETEIAELQAATRAITADYYADGTSHTQDGTLIQIVDRYYRSFEKPEPFTEAIWGMNGALCGEATPRVPGVGSLVTLVDCMGLGFEWIVLGDENFMWTRHADREILHKGAIQLLADPTCCASQEGPYCATPAVASCVAAYDAYCVDVAWDSLCVQELQWLDCGVCPE